MSSHSNLEYFINPEREHTLVKLGWFKLITACKHCRLSIGITFICQWLFQGTGWEHLMECNLQVSLGHLKKPESKDPVKFYPVLF